jgi:endonuclease/exonuclease/phosphatase family metal-dependent hydrolase
MATAAALGGAVTAAVPSVAAPSPGSGTPVTVMTRNLYLGGDITRPLRATSGLTGPAAFIAFGQANHALAAVVDQTDFPARSTALAREIAEAAPDVVGLQEVALWRHGPLQVDPALIGIANAGTVDYDFLATLTDDLAALGADYKVAELQEESDVEGPAFAAFPGDPTSRDVRLTMRDVMLVKTGRVKVLDSDSGQYLTRIPFTIAGKTFTFLRGYNWADIKVGTKKLRVVNTHLESQLSTIALLQAGELLRGPLSVTDRAVVLVCDCNSDPLNGSIKPEEPAPTPHWAPYRLLTQQGGMADEWLAGPGDDPGFTSGFSETVDDPDISAIDHRIDLVLARAAGGGPLAVQRAEVVGVDPAEKVDGLWPSDHAGVVARLRP